MYSKPTSSMSSKPITALDPNIEEQRKIAARKEAEAQAVLEDPEDEGMQMILQSEIEPTLHINEFIAANELPELRDTTGRKNIPVACEALWRDINSMVDRLGLNSRALKSFVLGHSTLGRKGRRTKDDLDSPDDWVLVETVDVGAIVEQDLAWELEGARVNNIEDTQALLRTISKDLVKLRAKEDDMRKIIASHVDPEQAAVAKSMPLSAEQATQQNELRRSYATFAQRLAEAEEGLTLLKVRIASAGGAGLGGLSAGGTRTAVPTVDAIIRTINKMTNMAEKRSGDVDVLETQMRKLRLGSVGVGGSPGPARSREGSPFVGVGTPQKQIGAGRRSVLFMSPERGLRDSVSSSVGLSTSRGGTATPPRKKMSMYSDEEKTAVRLRQAKRARMFALLRTSLERNGPNVQRLSDDD